MRNKIILAMAAAGMMYGASVFAADTTPTAGPFGSGKITFTGTITNSPCDIAPGDDAITVPFGQISYRKLNTANATTDSKPFTIHLQNCAFDPNTPDTAGSAGKMSKVTVSFSGAANTSKKAYTTSGIAQHVGVQLLKSDNATIIDPNTPMPDGDAQQLQAGNNELNFFARLIALDNGVTPGDFNASVTYTLKYL
ncbi:fimbrial protein [Salmonella enterica subsp. enterica serovar Senftenberg]|uniref:Fimbrial protein n=4 Tax=Salmonella enterica TaxID=28901 RepID=A0A3V2HYH1_SALSE|nr:MULTISPECIES: fimbrial protein [Salmonella]EAW1156609.1 fimbrial protein [Salmonella enterica subsp. enterica]EBF1862528.1 fimbrial protein [Salmonella enterica subsp. enterica serovar Heidelberg]ECH8095550.1 fimbrial protein [Salmonella enterica subsp. enterica serovar Miami]ECS6846319.1 fimbrial protein [Salmonella enterica subsp. enterica serovar Westhampton]EDB5584109.1 fimbrial protein [Salmonella enterica subsp. enterica serovar Schwarzengrund]EDB5625617.1 fimbrial protein [Salmonell